jgi:hypothetical protein
MLPLVAALIYGVWRLVEHGLLDELAIALVAGSIASAICALWYTKSAFQPPSSGRVAIAAAFFGGLPWAFGLFLVVYLGVWAAIQAVTSHQAGVLPFIGAAFWAAVGFREMSLLKRVRRLKPSN